MKVSILKSILSGLPDDFEVYVLDFEQGERLEIEFIRFTADAVEIEANDHEVKDGKEEA